MHRELSERPEAARYFEFAGVMMVVLDRDQTVSGVNRKACEVLGDEEAHIVGRNWFDEFVPEDVREEVREVFSRLMEGEIEPVEYFENPILTRSGAERRIEWHNALLRDERGRVTATLSTGTDVTDRRRMEDELIRQKSLAHLGEMAAVVAHEVRNPLAGIRGALQNLKPRDDEARGAVFDEVIAEVDALNEVIEDLLFFARPRAPRLIPFRVLPLIEESSAALRRDPACEGTGLDVRGEDLVAVGDPKQIRRVFLNVLLNAAQATGGEGEIRVDVARDGERARIAVADRGPGMEEGVRARVFEPFFTTKHRGTGLGLPAARASLVAQGGSLGFEFPAAGGTVAVLHLPLADR